MKCVRTAMLTVLILAICAVVGTHTTTAQQAASGGASSTIISAGEPSALNAATDLSSFSSSSDAQPRGSELDPLHEADRAHDESTRDLRAKYQAATDPGERTKLSEELEQVITKHFEIRQQIRANELKELNAQIRRLQELHDRREQEKNQIISDRLRQILRNAEGLGWGSSDAGGTFGTATQRAPYGQQLRSVTPSPVPIR